MPYARKRSKSQRRRPRRSARRRPSAKKMPTMRRRNVVNVGRNFPGSMISSHRYSDTIVVDPIAGIGAYHCFRTTSVFDPDFTGVGHQPLGHDRMAAIYNRYTVLSARITCTFVGPGGSPAICGVKLSDNSTPTSVVNYQLVRENGDHCAYRVCSGTNNYKQRVTQTYTPRKAFDKPDWEKLKADSNSNPTNNAYFIMFVTPVNSTQDLGSLNCLVTIDYKVKWFDYHEELVVN